jgi:hypothetical protein
VERLEVPNEQAKLFFRRANVFGLFYSVGPALRPEVFKLVDYLFKLRAFRTTAYWNPLIVLHGGLQLRGKSTLPVAYIRTKKLNVRSIWAEDTWILTGSVVHPGGIDVFRVDTISAHRDPTAA